MAGAIIDLDLRELAKAQGALDRLMSFDRGELLAGVGAVVESQTRRRITDEKSDPDGKPWQSWSPRYAATRPPGKSLLQSEGQLLDSIQAFVDDDSVSVGSNLIYARAQQKGNPDANLPARGYLGLSEQNMEELQAELVLFFESLLQ